MTVTGCATCTKCGSGVPTAGQPGVEATLCIVFCEARKEFCDMKNAKPPRTRPRPSELAAKKMNEGRIVDAMRRSGLPRGSRAVPELTQLAPWKGPTPPPGNRRPLSPERLRRMLQPVRDRIRAEAMAQAADIAKTKIAKKAATAWVKLIPVVNVISTAYDIYDVATTGYDLYKMVDETMKRYSGQVYQIRPDVTIQSPNGSPAQIYDFKFDGDTWQPGQRELYSELVGRNNVRSIDQGTCKCR